MSFTSDLDRFVNKAKKRTNLARKKIAIEVFQRVIMKTPVDTGRARANWQASIGVPASGVVESTDKGPVNNTGGGPSPTKMEMADVVSGAPLSDDSIWLSNNLPYIIRLEDGWSQQAPNGMVKTTVAEYQGIAAEAMRQVKK